MQDETIELHIRAACRPGIETERLLADLVAHSWPGSTRDRTDPVLRGWLRHFRAVGPIQAVPACTCQSARCVACN